MVCGKVSLGKIGATERSARAPANLDGLSHCMTTSPTLNEGKLWCSMKPSSSPSLIDDLLVGRGPQGADHQGLRLAARKQG
jgi:hypothetical protein